MRTAVIDVGTLKSKFEVREFDKDLGSKVISREKELTILGRDLDKNDGMIIREAIEATVTALLKFKAQIEELEVDKYKAVTTETIRKAVNSKDVLLEIGERTGISLNVLSHKDEAEIYFHSVSKDFPNQTIAVSDIGGGSVQVVIGKDKKIFETYLFKTGTHFLQEKFSKTHHPTKDELQDVKNHIKKELKTLHKSKYKPEVLIYGSTNIINFLEAMKINLVKRNGKSEHPYQVDIQALYPLYDRIVALNYEDRMLLYKDEPYYMWSAENALLNIFRISENLGINTIIPSNNNISSGILYELVNSLSKTLRSDRQGRD